MLIFIFYFLLILSFWNFYWECVLFCQQNLLKFMKRNLKSYISWGSWITQFKREMFHFKTRVLQTGYASQHFSYQDTHTTVFVRHWRLSGKKQSACDAADTDVLPGLGRSPGGRNGKPTPVFLPGKNHGQRSLVGYSPWACKRVDHSLATQQQSVCERQLNKAWQQKSRR